MKIDRTTRDKIDSIETKVCKFTGVSEKSIINQDKSQVTSNARAMLWYILHVDCNYSVGIISDIYFRKPRNVFSQIAKMRDKIESFNIYKDMYDGIKNTLALQ